MDIMTGLLAPVLAVTLVGGQLDWQFDNSPACVGETLYAGCANPQGNTRFFWYANNSFFVEFGVLDEIGENKTLMSGGFIIATAILNALEHDALSQSDRVFFNTTLAITNSVNNTQFYCQTGGGTLDQSLFQHCPFRHTLRPGKPDV